MTVTTAQYAALITSQHADKPNFAAFVQLVVSGLVDNQNICAQIAAGWDVDTATGAQLDVIGQLVGFGRYIYVPTLGTVTLADADYRTLLLAKIAANFWDGTMASLQTILAQIFPGTGITLKAVDHQDMTMDIYVVGGTLTATQLALLKGDLLVPRPEGVKINGIVESPNPIFGLSEEDSFVSGLDIGYFVTYS